jgi:hypothetical protein
MLLPACHLPPLQFRYGRLSSQLNGEYLRYSFISRLLSEETVDTELVAVRKEAEALMLEYAKRFGPEASSVAQAHASLGALGVYCIDCNQQEPPREDPLHQLFVTGRQLHDQLFKAQELERRLPGYWIGEHPPPTHRSHGHAASRLLEGKLCIYMV